ncbi:MAG: PAS domain S-box protein [Sporomusaceae bacterium]|nr:PAS domain S-box protein [Sporomusaceae bacterium]
MNDDRTARNEEYSPAVPQYYFELIDIIPNAAYIKDANGVFLHCNKTYALFVNLPRDAIVGKTTFDLNPRQFAQGYHELDEELLERQGSGRFQVPFKRIDGKTVVADVLKTVIYSREGESAGVMGIVSDASQRSTLDDILQRYEMLLRYSRDFIWMIDPTDGRIIEVNLAACQAYGYSREEFRRLTIFDLRAPSEKGVVDAQIAAARQGGVLFEALHRRRDGNVFPVQINASGTRLGEREIVISIVRDISDTVRTREEMKRRNEYLSMLHETALSLINRLDTDDLLAQIVTRSAKLAGTENAFILLFDADGRTVTVTAGAGVCAKYIGQRFPAGAGMSAQIFATGRSAVIDCYREWPLRLDDSRLGVIETILGVPLKNGTQVTGIIGFIGLEKGIKFGDDEVRLTEGFANLASLALHNASLYSRLQAELETSRALEAELTAKNADLAETLSRLQAAQLQMVQQEKLAGIGQLAAGIAHEINNPLGFVLSNFEVLQKYLARLVEMIGAYGELHRRMAETDDRPLREAAERIDVLADRIRLDHVVGDLNPLFDETRDGINRVGEIVKALRMFSRVDQKDEYAEYDLNAGIRNTLTVARNEIKYVARAEQNLGDIPHIEALGGLINQVLLNLILNATQAIAVKDTGEEGVMIIRSFRDGDYVCCSIEDNGVGIPEEIIQDIFNPFFTTKPVGEGTGLGLSISYDIVVNKHGGQISVASKAGEGALFTIKLPIRHSD